MHCTWLQLPLSANRSTLWVHSARMSANNANRCDPRNLINPPFHVHKTPSRFALSCKLLQHVDRHERMILNETKEVYSLRQTKKRIKNVCVCVGISAELICVPHALHNGDVLCERAVPCSFCELLFHAQCVKLENVIYKCLNELNSLDWFCKYLWGYFDEKLIIHKRLKRVWRCM